MREICRRLASFSIDHSQAQPSFLAVCYQHEFRAAKKLGFNDPSDTILYALGQVAMQRLVGFEITQTPSSQPTLYQIRTVLYDEDAADLYGSIRIHGLPQRIAQVAATGVSYLEDIRTWAEWVNALESSLWTGTVLALLSGNADLKDELLDVFRHPDLGHLDSKRVQARHRLAVELFTSHARDPEAFRDAMRRELGELYLGRYTFLEKYGDLDEERGVGIYAEEHDEREHVANGDAPVARLTFTILPDDEGVSDFVTERARFHAWRPSGARFDVDRCRTDVLTRLVAWMGSEHCTLYRGNSTAEVRPLDGENITEDYLVLVIDRGSGGQDAVAISPARGRHATFVVRHDVSPLPWHEVFALPKRSAGDLGAKRMRFQSRWPMDEYEAMFQKVTTALTCPPDRFGEKFDYSEELGRYLL